jgi:ethanolamine permease
MLTMLFAVLMAAAYGYFLMTSAQRKSAAPDDMLSSSPTNA